MTSKKASRFECLLSAAYIQNKAPKTEKIGNEKASCSQFKHFYSAHNHALSIFFFSRKKLKPTNYYWVQKRKKCPVWGKFHSKEMGACNKQKLIHIK
jgi:hypothetical protein